MEAVTVNEVFKDLYRNPEKTSSLGGRNRFLASVSQERKDSGSAWLEGENAYTLHKPTISKFLRRKMIVMGPGKQLQADLLDVHALAEANEGVKFLRTIIDVFSKRAWIVPRS